MKKKLLTLFTLLLCAVGGVNSAWGARTLIAKVTVTSQTEFTTAGTLIGSGATSGLGKGSDLGKIAGNKAYVSITLSEGNYFRAGDEIEVGTSTTKSFQIFEGALGSNDATLSPLVTTGSVAGGVTSCVIPNSITANTSSISIGRTSSSYNGCVTYFAVYREISDTKYTVTFDAGSNGTCGTSSLTEENPGAGITLPTVTPNSGYTFNGWFTAATEGTKVGDAGDLYAPTANMILYAQYSEKSAPGISIDNYNLSTSRGEAVTFTATASGAPTPTVTWYQSESAVTSGGVSKGTGLTFMPDVSVEGTFYFYAVATNGVSPDASSSLITLTVTNPDKVAVNNAYYVTLGEQPVPNERLIGEDITMTFVNGKAGEGFTAAVEDMHVNSINRNYVASISGTSGNNGWKAKFEPTSNGKLSVAVVINNNKTFSITPNENVASFSYKGVNNASSPASIDETQTGSSFTTGSATDDKLYVIVTVDVESGKEYSFSVAGSKMGFFGFEFVPATVSGTITASGYNTFSSNYPLNLSTISGGTAYVASSVTDGKVVLTKVANKIVAAGTGLMIAGAVDATFTIGTTSDAATFTGDNLFVGMPSGGKVPVAETGYYNYVFGWTTPSDPGFYKVVSDLPELGAGKAYLHTNSELGATSARLALSFEEGETTGIQSMDNGQWIMDNVFDLQGRRVAQPTKGLYIINGRKVVVK